MSGLRKNQTIESLCVYCGSSHGCRAEYAEAATELGQRLAEASIQVVFGGGSVGLMGEVADACLAAGGRVIGVLPERLATVEVKHEGCTELHIVPDMHARKALMADFADGFVALPGGIGTFEELFEIATWRQLGYHEKPIYVVNVAGFYDPLVALLSSADEAGFLRSTSDKAALGWIHVLDSVDDLLERLQ